MKASTRAFMAETSTKFSLQAFLNVMEAFAEIIEAFIRVTSTEALVEVSVEVSMEGIEDLKAAK